MKHRNDEAMMLASATLMEHQDVRDHMRGAGIEILAERDLPGLDAVAITICHPGISGLDFGDRPRWVIAWFSKPGHLLSWEVVAPPPTEPKEPRQ